MPDHILMNVTDEQELRVAIITDGRLETVIHERSQGDDGQLLGSIYKAKVANVEPSLDAAFLDLGTGKNGFIHIEEVRHDKGAKARIEQVLRPGDELLVQITKEAIRDKGPCVTTWLSVPGRCLVMMQGGDRGGISKKIEDPATRRRLRDLLGEIEAPEGFGFIIRTASADRDDEDIKFDAEYCRRLWSEIAARGSRARAPACIYREADVVLRTLRDVVTNEVERIVIDNSELYDEARAFAQVFMPELSGRIDLHREEEPLFTYYGVDERLSSIADRRVELPSGGNVVIEQTEALVSIDVNSSKNRESADVEQTALMTNLEAVGAIAEQLVLRDLGGLIVVDFIDMEQHDHQRLVQLALRRALLGDKARTQVAPMTRFGLIEMTRQRRRPSHRIVSYVECPHCRGTGSVKSPETFEIDLLRAIRAELARKALGRIEAIVPNDLAVHVLNARRGELERLEREHDCRVVVVGDHLMKGREFRLLPSVRKGSGRRRGEKPIRPGLLTPMLEEKARALAAARELLKVSPRDLERELLSSGYSRPAAEPSAPALVPAAVAVAVAPDQAPSPWQEAATLRHLLFSPARPSRVSSGEAGSGLRTLAKDAAPAKSPRSSRGSGRGKAQRRRRA